MHDAFAVSPLVRTAQLRPAADDVQLTFAERILIPPQWRDEMLSLPTSSHEVIRFARKIGVAPGIVVGQLQFHRRVKASHLNGLKRRFTWN
jgi:HTH-type transcriptional regulator / antitoxin HigA